jgi:isoamylase/glycogen operon protein
VSQFIKKIANTFQLGYSEGMKYPFERGCPNPLGASKTDEGINFAFHSAIEEGVSLLLYSTNSKTPFAQIPLDPKIHRTDSIWHIRVQNLPPIFEYGIKVGSQILIDPYAKEVNSNPDWGGHFYAENQPLAKFSAPQPFDWGNDVPPRIPFQDLIIYEMHIRGFTHGGGFQKMIDKIPHLKELGINAVEFLPIFEFDECENPRSNPETGRKLYNYWGYSTINFFSLMNRYGTIEEFKNLVKELHKNKIEVILDVVYNHTAEGNEKGKTLSFRGLDEAGYYILGPKGEYYNYSGCGNTFNCNNPVVSRLILDSLRYWVSEMHIDGFRFDLASILTRDPQGHPIADPPVIKAISQDPLLTGIKLIAEAWDAAGLYQVGYFPSYKKWAEWNGKYRDIVRKFLKGTDGVAGPFAGALSGSQDLYGHDRKPYHSINFVTAHDGFTLKDLCSYNNKHNFSNGENNQDGTNDNESWNCGQEGPTTNTKINQFRFRQSRNFIVALMVSLGTPMILMGDEYGQTHNGNNNTWCHDELNWFDWGELSHEGHFYRFFRSLVLLRKKNTLFRRSEFLTADDVEWHGTTPFHADWSPASRFIAYILKDKAKQEDVYIAFNASHLRTNVQLPPPPAHKKWHRLVDTALDSPYDFLDDPFQFPHVKTAYKMEAHSSIILIAL